MTLAFAIIGFALVNLYAWSLGRDLDRASAERKEILTILRRLADK